MRGKPGYLLLAQTGELKKRADDAREFLKNCRLCPQLCGINRTVGEKGICRAGDSILVSSVTPHFGEEKVLVGKKGSGTIFFGLCNLKCVFCQNYELSHFGEGHKITVEQFADAMLQLQDLGCHNINFVSPTHFAAQIVQAVAIAADMGLNIPLVYNTGGFDSIETLKLLVGIIDIYMPDVKFWDEGKAYLYLKAKGYPKVMKAAIKEMHRQVGDLKIDENGLAYKGLLVRHLVMPRGLAGTKEIMIFLAQEISPSTYVNIMGQYQPCYLAKDFPELNRAITRKELMDAVRLAEEAGLTRIIF
ncbi:MAG: radical SAM protein [Bacillota bacterium]|jgi:putative pyruvate formate lyase activating enzyme|nr:radical SAM protein [Clostridia bacterium]